MNLNFLYFRYFSHVAISLKAKYLNTFVEVSKKSFNNDIAMSDMRRFGEHLYFNFSESDPSKWGTKKEWAEFATKCFSSARPTERYIKGGIRRFSQK